MKRGEEENIPFISPTEKITDTEADGKDFSSSHVVNRLQL